MIKITTDEVRVCKRCSESYQHIAFFWEEKQDGKDYNSEHYTCPTCDPIIEKEEIEERKRQELEKKAVNEWYSTVPPLYRKTDTSHPDYPQAVHRKAIEWLEALAQEQASDYNAQRGWGVLVPKEDSRPWLGLTGQSGRCKTRVISQVLKRIIWNGNRCEWVNATEFQRLVQGQWNNEVIPNSFPTTTVGGKARGRLETLRDCNVLTLDDLGKGRITDTVAGALYELIEERAARRRITLWTSNASLDDLLEMLPSDCGGPIVRRLFEFSTIIKL